MNLYENVKYFMSIIRRLTYCQDGLLTIHNADFIDDAVFRHAYESGKKTGSWGTLDVQWRMHVACWATRRCMELEGDFVECGVNRGGLAMTVMEYNAFAISSNKRFYLLDTYEGIDGNADCYEYVKELFYGYPVEIIRGRVPDTLSQVRAKKIAFLSIDMNHPEPEIDALECFWGRLSTGAVVLLDDYGYAGHLEQKKAFDGFASKHNIKILCLPTGQGVIIK